jgi:hypothetical protein
MHVCVAEKLGRPAFMTRSTYNLRGRRKMFDPKTIARLRKRRNEQDGHTCMFQRCQPYMRIASINTSRHCSSASGSCFRITI